MFASAVRCSRTTYRGARGSGPGASGRTDSRSSPSSRSTLALAVSSGQVFKRSQRGLFDGKLLQTGNTIPKSRQKTLRRWLPNVQNTKLWSDTFAAHISTKVTTAAMRSIDKMGGIDFYLANTSDAKLGEMGRNLKDQLALKLRFDRVFAHMAAPNPNPNPNAASPDPEPRLTPADEPATRASAKLTPKQKKQKRQAAWIKAKARIAANKHKNLFNSAQGDSKPVQGKPKARATSKTAGASTAANKATRTKTKTTKQHKNEAQAPAPAAPATPAPAPAPASAKL